MADPSIELLPPESLRALQTAQQHYSPAGEHHHWTFPRAYKAWPMAAEDRPLPHATASHPKQEEQSGYKAESQPSRHSENSAECYQNERTPPCLTMGLRGLDAYLGNDRELNVKCL